MKVFISYSFADENKFDDICYALGNRQIAYWNTKEIAAGEELRDKLRSAIQGCGVCVFVATKNSLASEWCKAEVGAFWGAGKPVIVYLADDNLDHDQLPPQFKADLWADKTRDVVNAVELHISQATEPTFVREHPANVFWLGHDLARAIRIAKFEPDNRAGLEDGLKQAIHHLNAIELHAPDARKLLLNVIKSYRDSAQLPEEQREKLVTAIAKAKNELGDLIARLQPGFAGYPTIGSEQALEQEIAKT